MGFRAYPNALLHVFNVDKTKAATVAVSVVIVTK